MAVLREAVRDSAAWRSAKGMSGVVCEWLLLSGGVGRGHDASREYIGWGVAAGRHSPLQGNVAGSEVQQRCLSWECRRSASRRVVKDAWWLKGLPKGTEVQNRCISGETEYIYIVEQECCECNVCIFSALRMQHFIDLMLRMQHFSVKCLQHGVVFMLHW